MAKRVSTGSAGGQLDRHPDREQERDYGTLCEREHRYEAPGYDLQADRQDRR